MFVHKFRQRGRVRGALGSPDLWGTRFVRVEVQPVEEESEEHLPQVVRQAAEEFLRLSEEFKQGAGSLLGCSHVGRICVVELLSDLVAFQVEILEPLGELLGGPVRLPKQIHALVLEVVKSRQLGLQALAECFASGFAGADGLA